MALDIEDKIYDAVAAMEADATLAALEPRPKFIVDSGYYSRAKRSIWRGLQDYPQVRIENQGALNMAQQPPQTPHTFLMNKANFAAAQCDVPVAGQFRVGIVIIHLGIMPLEKQSPLETEIRRFLMAIYPTLGVTDGAGRTFVNHFAVGGTRRIETNDDTKRVPRTVVRLTLTAAVRVYLSQLVA